MVTVKKTKQKKTEYVVHKSTAVITFVPVRSNYSCTQIVLPQISPKFIVSLWYTVCFCVDNIYNIIINVCCNFSHGVC